jgi:hypothetical protein
MNATIYCARKLSLADIRAAATAWQVRAASAAEELATLESSHGNIKLTSMPESEIPGHLAGLEGYVASSCTIHDESFGERVGAVVQVIGCLIEVDDVEIVDRLLFAIAARGRAMIFDGAAFISEQRELLAGPDDDELTPPTAERVLRRTLALAAVAMRAYLEAPNARDGLAELRDWVAKEQLDDELEPNERAVINAARGMLSAQQQVDASWRSEGVVVLGWALGAGPLPNHETQGDPFEAARALGFLQTKMIEPALRTADEIEREGRRALGIHWRLREFSLRQEPVDFEKFSRESWFGGFDIGGIPLAEGDLAIRGVPITRAGSDDIGLCSSIARERHHAFNWLAGVNPIYSEVDTPT